MFNKNVEIIYKTKYMLIGKSNLASTLITSILRSVEISELYLQTDLAI